jgi:hypothetical protein
MASFAVTPCFAIQALCPGNRPALNFSRASRGALSRVRTSFHPLYILTYSNCLSTDRYRPHSVVMSGGITFGATITGGIQNVAGLLPLLGTQQCEEHIGSALTMGYLYAAATPMSIFGSLGVARAGFKALIACMSGRTWSGAKILANMGFERKDMNLSLVMVDKNDKDGRHLAETRFDEFVKEHCTSIRPESPSRTSACDGTSPRSFLRPSFPP